SESNEAATPMVWRGDVRPRSAEDDMAASGLAQWDLQSPLDRAGGGADRFVQKISLPTPTPPTVVLAARGHDLRKRRLVWQRAIGNIGYDPKHPETAWAKSGNRPRCGGLARAGDGHTRCSRQPA